MKTISSICCLLFQFAASTDKLFFWLDVYSIVDAFTIGPSLYGVYTDVNWLGKSLIFNTLI